MGDSTEEQRRAAVDARMGRLLTWVTLIVGVLTFAVAVGTLVNLGLELRHITTNLFVMLLCGAAQALVRAGRVHAAAHLFIALLWATIAYSCFLLGGTRSPVLATFSPVIAITAVVMSRRAGLVYAALSAAAIGAVFAAEFGGGWVPPPNNLTPLLSGGILAAAVLMTGGVIYLAAGLREDSERRASESEGVFTELVRTAPEGIVTLDPKGAVASVNPAAEALLGSPSRALLGRPLAGVSGFAEALHWPEKTTVPVKVTRPDGSTRELEVARHPLRVDGEQGARVSLSDVTERLASERERAQLTDQLHQSQKQESIGLLAGGIAHDFNNLITVAMVNIDFARQQGLPADVKRSIDDVEDAIRRSADLTRQLLAFSRRQVLSTRDVAVNEVVTGLRSMLRRLVVESIDLRFELNATGLIRADPGQLEQVLVNLVVNARDAMSHGGTLTVSTADAPAAPGQRAGVVVAVQDTGTGMTPEVAARIFEPFFTTKPVGHGTGLGLAVVDGIVRQSGGTVKLDTAPGKGTRFEVWFPTVEASAPDQAAPAAAPVVDSGRGRVVLLVEDEPSLREVVARELERVGFEVRRCADGEDAVRMGQAAGRLDLVLTDVVMPRLNGPEAVQRLRASRPHLKALFVSGYSDKSLQDLGVLGPHSSFTSKPFRLDELLQSVFALLARPT